MLGERCRRPASRSTPVMPSAARTRAINIARPAELRPGVGLHQRLRVDGRPTAVAAGGGGVGAGARSAWMPRTMNGAASNGRIKVRRSSMTARYPVSGAAQTPWRVSSRSRSRRRSNHRRRLRLAGGRHPGGGERRQQPYGVVVTVGTRRRRVGVAHRPADLEALIARPAAELVQRHRLRSYRQPSPSDSVATRRGGIADRRRRSGVAPGRRRRPCRPRRPGSRGS